MTPEDIMRAVMFFVAVADVGWGIWWKIDGRDKDGEKATSDRIKALEERAAKDAADLAQHQGMPRKHLPRRLVCTTRRRNSCARLKPSAAASTAVSPA